MVRAEVEIHIGRLFAGRIKERTHLGGIVLYVTASLFLHFRFNRSLFEILFCDEYGREELILESDPVQTLRNGLFVVFTCRKVIHIITGVFVGEVCQTVFVSISLFDLAGTL